MTILIFLTARVNLLGENKWKMAELGFVLFMKFVALNVIQPIPLVSPQSEFHSSLKSEIYDQRLNYQRYAMILRFP